MPLAYKVLKLNNREPNELISTAQVPTSLMSGIAISLNLRLSALCVSHVKFPENHQDTQLNGLVTTTAGVACGQLRLVDHAIVVDVSSSDLIE